jgi:hypothetical protein
MTRDGTVVDAAEHETVHSHAHAVAHLSHGAHVQRAEISLPSFVTTSTSRAFSLSSRLFKTRCCDAAVDLKNGLRKDPH